MKPTEPLKAPASIPAVYGIGDGVIRGYASLFGLVDLAGDRIEPGAFRASLARRGTSGIRMLWQHESGRPIGVWTAIDEDRNGLLVEGRLALGTAGGREAFALIEARAVDGLSIGFRTRRAEKPPAGAGGGVRRRLVEVDLWEISIVTFPMQERARVIELRRSESLCARDRPSGDLRPAAAAGHLRAGAAGLRAATARLAATRGGRGPTSFNPRGEDMPEITMSAPETKARTGETTGAYADFMEAFAGSREANDERLSQLECRMSADILTEEKVERIGKAIDAHEKRLERLALKEMRPRLGGAGASEAGPSEHKQAFEAYVRGGDGRRLRQIEEKAMSGLTGADGGFLVPEETETEIGRRLASISPIRAIASVRAVSSSVLKKPFAISGAQTGWVAETDARPGTNAPLLAELSFPTMELYAMPAATSALLDDAVVDIDRWIGEEVEQAFAAQESTAFVTGDGVSKPKGFMTYDTVAESVWTWGKVGTVSTGANGAFLAGAAGDALIDLVYALKAGYRQNASFVMNRRTQSAVRKLKDGDGNYLWQAPAAAGARATLMGFPMVEAEDMPDIATGSSAIAFGDFQRFYLVVDRQGVRVLRDPYSAKPYVLFYTTKRVGGGVQDFDAAKFLKFAI